MRAVDISTPADLLAVFEEIAPEMRTDPDFDAALDRARRMVALDPSGRRANEAVDALAVMARRVREGRPAVDLKRWNAALKWFGRHAAELTSADGTVRGSFSPATATAGAIDRAVRLGPRSFVAETFLTALEELRNRHDL